MRVIRGLSHASPPLLRSVATFGNYDGVHLGHRRILERVKEAAREHEAESVVALFDPHPVKVLRPDKDFRVITTLDSRLEMFASLDLDAALVIPFDRTVAAIEAEDFVTHVIGDLLHVRHIVLGGDARFGHGRRGDTQMLRDMGAELGFCVEVVGAVEVDGIRVSSSAVRRAVAAGNVELAARMLGQPFFLTGEIVGGDQRGRQIGFPTANLRPDVNLAPSPGVYEGRLVVQGEPHVCVVNVGFRPTFGEGDMHIEAHVLDFHREIYGERVRLSFLRRLRDEQRFEDVSELIAQIRSDVDAVRRSSGEPA